MVRALKNDTLMAKILGTRGDIAFYRGDYGAAATLFQSALQAATKGGERNTIVEAKLNLARVAIAQGHAAEAVNRLKPLVDTGAASDRSLALIPRWRSLRH